MMPFWDEEAAAARRFDEITKAYGDLESPIQLKGRVVLDELEQQLGSAFETGRPELLLRWTSRLFEAHGQEAISHGTWLDLQGRLEDAVGRIPEPERACWTHLLECTRAMVCAAHLPFRSILPQPNAGSRDAWNRRILATLQPGWTTRYRIAVLAQVCELFPGSESEEQSRLAEQVELSHGAPGGLVPPPSEWDDQTEPQAREAWAYLLALCTRAAMGLEGRGGLRGLAERLGNGAGSASVELLLYHWAARCGICRELLETWVGDLWPPFELPSPPALKAERGPELDVLVAGPPGVGKTSLLFALEKEKLLSVVPVVPLLSPRSNPFAKEHREEEVVQQWRDRWQRDQLVSTAEPEVQGRPETSPTLFFPNLLDIPGEFFTTRRRAGSHWLGRWYERRSPAGMVVVFKLDGTTKRLHLETQELADAYRSLLGGKGQGAPVHLVVNALDQAGLDPETLPRLTRPLRLVAREGAPAALLAEDHHRLSACLPALQRVSQDLASLAEKGLTALALSFAGGAPVRLHYTCFRSAPEVESLRRDAVRSFWKSLVDDLAEPSRASRQSWFEERFKRKPEHGREIVQRLEKELDQLVRSDLKALDDSMAAVIAAADSEELLEKVGYKNPGRFQFLQSELKTKGLEVLQGPWGSYDRALEQVKRTTELAARTTLELLGVAGAASGEGLSIAQPLDESQEEAVNTGVRVTLSLPDTPREVVVHMQQGVLVTGSQVLDGAEGVAEQLAAMASMEGDHYQPIRLLDFEGENLGEILQLLVGSADDGPFHNFSFHRGDLDIFQLASSPAEPEGFPPVADLKRVFQRLAALWQWRNEREQAWREDRVAWLTRRLAEELIRQSGHPRSSGGANPVPAAVSEALAAMGKWTVGIFGIKREKPLQEMKVKLEAALPGVVKSGDTLKDKLKDEERCGELRGMLRDVDEAFRVDSAPEDTVVPVTDEARQTLTKEHRQPLAGAVGKGGGIDSVVGRYESAILAQRRQYLSESGWLETVLAHDSERYLALASTKRASALVGTSARPRESLSQFIEVASAACADASLW